MVDAEPRHKKAAAVRTTAERMNELDREMTLTWQKIITQRKKLNEAIAQTVPLENLSTSIYGQFFKQIQQRVRAISDKPSYTIKSRIIPTQSEQEPEEKKSPQKATSQVNVDKSNDQVHKAEKQTKRATIAKNLVKSHILRETVRADSALDTTKSAVEQKADRISQTSEIYMLKQETQDLLILDFEKKFFRQRPITQRFPYQSKSIQILNGDIFVVGGLNRTGKGNE